MGNIFAANVNIAKQDTTNNVYQQSEQQCAASCQNVQSGNNVFLDGSTTGDIIFKQRCEANAGCMMNNSVASVIALLQEQKQAGSTESSLFGGVNFGTVNLNSSDQDIENSVKQILNTICTADIDNEQSDNMVYARNSNTGNIIFEQGGNATANCVMVNAANADLNIRQTGDQSAFTGAAGLGGILTGIIILVIIIVIAAVVIKTGPQLAKSSQQQGARPAQPARPARPATRPRSGAVTSR